MGAVTGKGLSDLIREEFGFRITFLLMAGLGCHQLRQRGRRVCRHRGQPRALRNSHLGQRPLLRRARLDDGRQGQLQVGGEGLPRRIVYLSRLHRRRSPRPSRLEGRGNGDPRAAQPASLPQLQLHLHGHRSHRHHHRSLDAVLPAILGGREGNHREAVRRLAPRRHRRLHLHRRGRLVHRRRLRRHALRRTGTTTSRMARKPRSPCAPWPASSPTSCSPSDSSTPRSSPPPSFPSPRPTRSARASASSPASTRNSAKRPSSTGSTPASSSPEPASFSGPTCPW